MYADPIFIREFIAELSTLVPPHEARELCAAAIGNPEPVSFAEILARSDDEVTPQQAERARGWARERKNGRLLQYLTGHAFFHDRFYRVGPGVLVPRPETEVLLVSLFHQMNARGFGSLDEIHGAEIGVGSGILSVELLLRYPKLSMKGTESSVIARGFAGMNLERLLGSEAKRFSWLEGSTGEILEPYLRYVEKTGRKFDFLVSNPPYLADASEMTDEVRREEPPEALIAEGVDPLLFYRAIAEGAREILSPGALIALEIPHERAGAIRELFKDSTGKVEIFPDLSGRERVLIQSFGLK